VTEFGITSEDNEEHSEKQDDPMDFTEFERVRDVNEEHPDEQ
jgi:hypothetical protein